MQKPLLLILCLAPFWLTAQTVDSVVFRQVDSLIKVSGALTDEQKFDKAFEVGAAAEQLALEKLGKESAAYAKCCSNRGRVNLNKGNYSESEKWYFQAKAIQEKTIGKQHYDYAVLLNNLALLYYYLQDYEKAELFFLEALSVYEKVLGKEHLNFAACLDGLGLIYYQMGDYEKAEPIYLESKAIYEKKLGIEHPQYASCLNNLAILYNDMGNSKKAETLYLEAQSIIEKTQGKENPEYAVSLNNLALRYHDDGDYEKAELLYLEAIAIYEKIQGKESPWYAISLFNLGTHYFDKGDYEKAEPLHVEAKALLEKTLGKEHPIYAEALDDLATLYLGIDNYEKSEQLYVESTAIREKVLGKGHPDYVSGLRNLVPLYMAMGNYEKAEPLYVECAQRSQSLLQKAVRHLSERELRTYLDEFSKSQDQALSFVQLSANKIVAAACFDNALFYKGFLLQATGQIKRMSFLNPVAAESFSLLKSYERRLAAQYAQPIAERDSATVAEMESKANDLEKELARTVAGFGQALRQVTWQQVQAALKPNEAAIEFVHYRFHQKKQTNNTFYAALVLQPGPDAPQFIPLIEEKQLTTLLQTEGKPKADFYNQLYAASAKGSQLYDLIWKPIAAALPEGATVYASPSGLLHRLNLAAIPTPDGKTLAEKHRLSTVGSTRQLVVPAPSATNPNTIAQLYGGIQYDATPVVAANTDVKPGDDIAARRGPDFTQNDSTLRGDTWNYLRWTEVEISAAAEIMKSKGMAATLKKGAEATEESFKAIGTDGPSPRILHVATHGFFFPDPKDEQASGEKAFKVSDNPMIRSGLVLAGGNHAWKTGKPLQPGSEDGILTAYESSQMNLSNTELAVLSACETGLGDLVGNEGVYGLQRAFKIAGVRYLIMSLWQVPDFQTQVFMTAFYKNWLEEKMAVPEAFRATQAELRGKYSGEAFKWAGFVLVE